MSCKKAIGVAQDMKKLFGEEIALSIYTTDSEEAKQYGFRGATNVLLDERLIPLEISKDSNKMKDFLSEKFT